MTDKLRQMGESRQTSNVRRNIIEFERIAKQNRIDRTETSFAGESRMTMKDLKEAAKRRQELVDKY
ncbi:MAG: hypothetical protein IJ419_07315 [Agathobacter sp.]|nr:hypothetical protein [Agathobacter sp.]